LAISTIFLMTSGGNGLMIYIDSRFRELKKNHPGN